MAAGQCEAERDLISARLCRGERAVIAGGGTGRNTRHDHRRDCDRNDAERQLVEPVSVIEPRHRRAGDADAMAAIAISFSCGTPVAIKPGSARLKNVSVWSAECARGRCQRLPLDNQTVTVNTS